jgi:hypothetical protein
MYKCNLLYFCIGEYHKYDNIAYPKNAKVSKSVKEYSAKDVVSVISRGLISGSFPPLSHQAMSERCLECYLMRIKEMLCNGLFPDGYDINSIAMEISFIYESLCVEFLSVANNPITKVVSVEKRIDVKVSWCILYNNYKE